MAWVPHTCGDLIGVKMYEMSQVPWRDKGEWPWAINAITARKSLMDV